MFLTTCASLKKTFKSVNQCDFCLRVIPIEIVNETNNESDKIKSSKEKKSTVTTNGGEVISCKENMNEK